MPGGKELRRGCGKGVGVIWGGRLLPKELCELLSKATCALERRARLTAPLPRGKPLGIPVPYLTLVLLRIYELAAWGRGLCNAVR